LGLASLSPPPLDADTSGRDSLEQLRAIAKTTADLALLVASYHFDKDGDRALALLGEIQPPTATSLTAQGSVFQSLKRLDEAQAAFQKAVALDGRFARAYDGLGAVMRARGRNAQALSYFEKSAELDPARAGPHTQLGLIHESEGRYEKALDEFKKAEALGPRTSVPRLHAGSLYDLLGRRREAEAELRALMEKIKNNPDEKLQVGPVYALILLRAGKAKDADAVLAGLAGPAWPASMSAFLAGKLGEEAFLRSAEAGDPQEKPRRLCQAYYFAGARLSLSGRPQDAARARGYFQKAVAAGKENVLEFQRARFELSRPK
ncbi:MAG TPA: tetratricopeptide repeat protein, partial [Elusimicrobiota bacterium]|nr:tetratricopeptide repeat protein [Elusimicrobiota bacterium]